MTLEEFRAKYRLQQRLTQRGVASYHAVDSSGRVVMVHSLDSASREEVDRVRGMIHQLNAADRKRILEILDVDGVPVIVTDYLQVFQTLAQWLEVRTRSAPAAPTVPTASSQGPPRGEFTQLFGPAEIPKTPIVESPKSATPTPAGGEFTQLFGAIGPAAADSHKTPQGPSTPLPPAPPAPPAPTAPTAPTASPTAGEFTRLFGAIKDEPASAAPTEPAPPATPTPPAAERPKIVVRWRESTPAEPPPPAAAKPQIRWKASGPDEVAQPQPPTPSAPSPKGPGDFTRLFGPHEDMPATSSPTQNDEPLAPKRSEPPAQARPAVPKGGFTQLLRAAVDSPADPTTPPEVSDAPPSPAPPPKGAPGAFTSLMEGLPSPPSGGGPESTARAGGGGLGQSEFTRMMSAVPAPAPAPGGRGQAAPTPAPAGEEGEEEGKPSLTKLFIALGVVLLLAVVLIVFFAIKK